ncbi:putative periplasmic binding protein-like I [Helianthus annuus]|nr:putative periplasmic binding protein-like I [Helianthus annuus]
MLMMMTRVEILLVFGMCVMVVQLMPMVVKGKTGNTTVSRSPSSSSSRMPSVVNVGALFTVNSVIGRSVKPAVAAAVDDVNKSPTVLRGITLNLIQHDTNCSGFLGTIEGT